MSNGGVLLPRLQLLVRVFISLLLGGVATILSSIVRHHPQVSVSRLLLGINWRDILSGTLLTVGLLLLVDNRLRFPVDVFSKLLSRFTTMEEYEKKLYWKRLQWALWAALLALGLVLCVSRLRWFKEGIGGIWEVLITLATLICVFFLTETWARVCAFGIPRHHNLGVPQLWWEFLGRYPGLDDLTKAKLLVFLFKADGDELEIKGTFAQYLMILCAATYFAQREWFATYTMPITEWANIHQDADEYFKALRNTHLRRKRIVIRPKSELDLIAAGLPIVTDTEESGATLYGMTDDSVKTKGFNIEDCAIFDNELAVVGGTLSTTTDIQPSSLQVNIRLLKGAAAARYIGMKKYLESMDPYVKFPPAKSIKKSKSARRKVVP